MRKVDFTILDPMGNLTALVETKTPKSQRFFVAKKIITDHPIIEQVGFIINGNLEMMGSELSINGTLAAGYYMNLNKTKSASLREVKRRSNLINLTRLPRFARNDKGIARNDGLIEFSTSGISVKVKYFLKKNLPTISLVISYKIVKIDGFDFVDLGGIGYFIVPVILACSESGRWFMLRIAGAKRWKKDWRWPAAPAVSPIIWFSVKKK